MDKYKIKIDQKESWNDDDWQAALAACFGDQVRCRLNRSGTTNGHMVNYLLALRTAWRAGHRRRPSPFECNIVRLPYEE